MLLILWLWLSAPFMQEGDLTVKITNTGLQGGDVRLAVYNNAETFLEDEGIIYSAIVPVETNTSIQTIFHIPFGDYAVAVYHDENSNGKLDMFMGVPTEPYGFSNDAKGVLGPPSFSVARFHFSSTGQEIKVRLK